MEKTVSKAFIKSFCFHTAAVDKSAGVNKSSLTGLVSKPRSPLTGLGGGPLEQFKAHSLIQEFAFIWILVGILGILAKGLGSTFKEGKAGEKAIQKQADGEWGVGVNIINNTMGAMVIEQIGRKGQVFLGVIVALFVFIAGLNLEALIPYTFSPTSHLSVTMSLSQGMIGLVVLEAVLRHGVWAIKLFIPKGIAGVMLPFLFVLELVSFLARILSLSVRVAANLLAGHVIMKLLGIGNLFYDSLGMGEGTFAEKESSFSLKSLIASFFIEILKAIGSFAILGVGGIFNMLEIGVSLIQGYVFCALSCSYLGESVYLTQSPGWKVPFKKSLPY